MKYKLLQPRKVNRNLLISLKNFSLLLLVGYVLLLVLLEVLLRPSSLVYLLVRFGTEVYLGLIAIISFMTLTSYVEYVLFSDRHSYRQTVIGTVLVFSLIFGLFVFSNSNLSSYQNLFLLLILPTFVVSFITISIHIDLDKLFSFNPTLIFIFSVFIVIILSTSLLSLPISSSSEPIPVVDALFIAVSAVSCTGLTTIDIGKDLSLFGQIILLFTIEVGGLLIIFISISGILYGFATRNVLVRIKVASSIQDVESIKVVERSITRAIRVIFISQLVGAILILPFIYRKEGDLLFSIFSSIFHSIAGFNNAGFSLYSDSLFRFRNDYAFLIIISALMLIGSTGVIVIDEVIEIIKNFFKKLHSLILLRKVSVEKFSFSLHSKLTLVFHICLIVFGTLLFIVFEKDNIFKDVNEFVANAIFNSISLRTTGYVTVDTSKANEITYLLSSILMFIGGGSVSIAGGIKVSTFAVLFLFMVAFIKSQKSAMFSMKIISTEVLVKSVYILISSLMFLIIMLVLFYLSLEGKDPISKVIFEVTSAFGTVGISSGIVSKNMPLLSKIVLIATMFFGKIGSLSLVAVLSSRITVVYQYNYPEGKVVVG